MDGTLTSLATFTSVLDVLAVAFIIYQVLLMVRGRRASHILLGVLTIILFYVAAAWTGLELLRSVLAYLAPYTAFALIVMFQSELRRFLARIGRQRWLTFDTRVRSREFADEILLAATQLAETRTGALIVVERDIGLRSFVESGVALDACLSHDLLLAIFQHKGSLHDGAVIVQGDRVAAAACFLPLSTSPSVLRSYGTRHRAAIGVTEETDCLTLVVSEETGQISVATFGELESNLTIEQAEERLVSHFSRQIKRQIKPATGFRIPIAAGKPHGED